MLFGIAVVALLVGAGLVWALMRGSVAAAGALARSESAAQLAALQATAEAAEREKATLRGQAAQFESLLDARRADISQLRQELGKAQAEAEQMAELRRALEEQRAGAEAAARHYYRKSVSQLSPFEAARLAVMLPRPRYFEKLPNSPYLSGRAEVIVGRMGGAELP